LPHVSFSQFLYADDRPLSPDDIKRLFTTAVFKKLSLVERVIFVLDEAQEYFGEFQLLSDNQRKKDYADMFLFFQTHRHYGVDIYLITQDLEGIVKPIRSLIETEYRHTPGALSFSSNTYRYGVYAGRVKVSSGTFSGKPYYGLYKTSSGRVSKTHSKITPLIIIAVLLFSLSAYNFHRFYKYSTSDLLGAEKSEKKEKNKSDKTDKTGLLPAIDNSPKNKKDVGLSVKPSSGSGFSQSVDYVVVELPTYKYYDSRGVSFFFLNFVDKSFVRFPVSPDFDYGYTVSFLRGRIFAKMSIPYYKFYFPPDSKGFDPLKDREKLISGVSDSKEVKESD